MEMRSAGRRKPEAASLFGAGGDLGHGQSFEDGFERVEEVEVFAAGGVFVGANEHFLGAAAGRDQADAGFDQADVGFGGGLNARAVQADFAAAAESQALRRDDDGRARVLESEIGVLEAAHGEVEVVPFLLLRGDQEQQEIGAGGKIHRLVGDDHGVEIGVQALHAGLDHGGDVVADGVHLGVKFAAEDAVAEIDEAGAGIVGDLPGAILERFENDDAGRLGNFCEGCRWRDRRPRVRRRTIRRAICGRTRADARPRAADRGLRRSSGA